MKERQKMFRRREKSEPMEEAPQPGEVEGPYLIDSWNATVSSHLELQDLMNARAQEGYRLVTTQSGHVSNTLFYLIWGKA
jgi:hypothetical protein